MNAVDVAAAVPAVHHRVHAGICPHSSKTSSGQCSGGGEAGRHPRARKIDIRFDLEDWSWRMRLIVLTVVALVLLQKNITPFFSGRGQSHISHLHRCGCDDCPRTLPTLGTPSTLPSPRPLLIRTLMLGGGRLGSRGLGARRWRRVG